MSSDVTFYTRLIKAIYECPTFFQIWSQSLIFHIFFFLLILSLSLSLHRDKEKQVAKKTKKTTLRKLFLFLSLSSRRFAWTLIRSTGNQNNSAGKYKNLRRPCVFVFEFVGEWSVGVVESSEKILTLGVCLVFGVW